MAPSVGRTSTRTRKKSARAREGDDEAEEQVEVKEENPGQSLQSGREINVGDQEMLTMFALNYYFYSYSLTCLCLLTASTSLSSLVTFGLALAHLVDFRRIASPSSPTLPISISIDLIGYTYYN
jgi:hypothetical protein